MNKIVLGIILCIAGNTFGMARFATRSLLLRNFTSTKTPEAQVSFESLSKQVQELKEDLSKKEKLVLRLEKELQEKQDELKRMARDRQSEWRRPFFGGGGGGA